MKRYQINIRYNHIKLHSRCLLRINKDLWGRKLTWKNYFKKGWFYTTGIIRALLPACHLFQTPNYHAPIYNLCNPPSGSQVVGSS